jgi:hypothetical protein
MMSNPVMVAQDRIVCELRRVAQEFGTTDAAVFAHRMEVELDRIYGNAARIPAPTQDTINDR